MCIKRKFSLVILAFLTPLVFLAAFNNQCFADDTDTDDTPFLILVEMIILGIVWAG